MSAVTTSYRKTIVASSVAGVAVIAVAYAGQTRVSTLLPALFVFSLSALGWVVGVLLLSIAIGGLLAEFRHSRLERGELDLFLAFNKARSEAALLDGAVRSRPVMFPKLRRWLGAPAFIVGDTVQICSLQEISVTLDADGCLDGLPFMPEMAKYCGTVGTVFRCVDKIYDYGGRKDMRRLKDTVSITGLRCDGGAHDGCQAQCYILWKAAWIKRTDVPATSSSEPPIERTSAVFSDIGGNRCFGPTFFKESDATEGRYSCQYTNLVRASTRLRPWDPRQDLRPLIAGNLTVMAFGVAMLTRLFNAVQRLRGGCDFPAADQSSSTSSLRVDLNLQPGEMVLVRGPEEIFETLDQSGRNRGLWFDQGMLYYCKRCYKVLSRVDKIIDDASGRIVRMKTPCLVLNGVDSHGEYMRFCAQHDYPFWREVWLERLKDRPPQEPISKLFEQHSDAGELHKPQEMGGVILPTNKYAALPFAARQGTAQPASGVDSGRGAAHPGS